MFYKGNILYKGNIQSVKEKLLDDLIAEMGGGGVQQKCGKIQYRKSPRKQNKKMENSGEK